MAQPNDNPLADVVRVGDRFLIAPSPPPTWRDMLYLLLQVANEAGAEGRAAANRELQRMARAADCAMTFHSALKLALPELREDLEALVHSETRLAFAWRADDPLPSGLDPEMAAIAARKQAAFDSVVKAIAAAEGR